MAWLEGGGGVGGVDVDSLLVRGYVRREGVYVKRKVWHMYYISTVGIQMAQVLLFDRVYQ